MDEEDLIICVARLVVQKLWPPLTSDDLRAISIASRNRLRLTSHFGSISELKITRKSMKFRVSEPSVLRSHFGMQNSSFSDGPEAENY